MAYGGAGDQGGEDFFQDGGFGEGEADLEEGAETGGPQQGAVAAGARELPPVRGAGAVARGVHLGESARGDGDDGEAGADDGDQARADVVGGLVDVEAGDLDGGEDAADDQRGGD